MPVGSRASSSGRKLPPAVRLQFPVYHDRTDNASFAPTLVPLTNVHGHADHGDDPPLSGRKPQPTAVRLFGRIRH